MKSLLFLLLFSTFSHAALLKSPPGVIFPFAGATCPAGSIAADHSNLLRLGKYNALFVALGGTGTAWGTADGTHFYSPDLRERSVKGIGTNADGNGGTTVSLGTYQADTTAVNGLALTDPGHFHGINTLGGPNNVSAQVASQQNTASPNGANTRAATTGITLSGDTETRPKAYGVLYCIWY